MIQIQEQMTHWNPKKPKIPIRKNRITPIEFVKDHSDLSIDGTRWIHKSVPFFSCFISPHSFNTMEHTPPDTPSITLLNPYPQSSVYMLSQESIQSKSSQQEEPNPRTAPQGHIITQKPTFLNWPPEVSMAPFAAGYQPLTKRQPTPIITSPCRCFSLPALRLLPIMFANITHTP